MDPEILKRIDALAEKVGVAAENLWAAGRGYVQARGLVYAATFLVVSVVSGLVFGKLVLPALRKAVAEHSMNDVPLGFAAVALFGAALACLGGAAIWSVDALAPDGALLKMLVGK